MRNIPVEAIGLRDGSISDIPIRKGMPLLNGIHTVTLYLGANNQSAYYSYILNLNPERVIFNPGTENPEFEQMLLKAGIDVEIACTIVMLHTGVF